MFGPLCVFCATVLLVFSFSFFHKCFTRHYFCKHVWFDVLVQNQLFVNASFSINVVMYLVRYCTRWSWERPSYIRILYHVFTFFRMARSTSRSASPSPCMSPSNRKGKMDRSVFRLFPEKSVGFDRGFIS